MSENLFDQLTFEKVQRRDLDQLETVFAAAFGDEVDANQIKRRIHRAKQFYNILHPLSKFSIWIKNLFNIYVVKLVGQVAGFIQISYLNPTQVHIDYVAFSKNYRGQGLGSWVLGKLLDDLADANNYDVVLEVGVDNPAYNFYRRFGFRRITEIFHYGRQLPAGYTLPVAQAAMLTGFRELRAQDRPRLYGLYLEAVPLLFRQVIKRSYGEFYPSMVVKSLERLKNYLMRNKKSEYVLEQDGKIVALLTISSYVKAKRHLLTLILHPAWEDLRQPLVNKAISLIVADNNQGTITTTIYGDNYSKQVTLERLGFRKNLVYHLMFRPSALKKKEMNRLPAAQGRPVLTCGKMQRKLN